MRAALVRPFRFSGLIVFCLAGIVSTSTVLLAQQSNQPEIETEEVAPCIVGQADCPWRSVFAADEALWERGRLYELRGENWRQAKKAPSKAGLCGGLENLQESLDLCTNGGCTQAHCVQASAPNRKSIWLCKCLKMK
jgi:hypothetical protein